MPGIKSDEKFLKFTEVVKDHVLYVGVESIKSWYILQSKHLKNNNYDDIIGLRF